MSVIGPRPGLWNQDILTAERDKYNANDVHDLCDHAICFLGNRPFGSVLTDRLYEFCKRSSGVDPAAGDFKIPAFFCKLMVDLVSIRDHSSGECLQEFPRMVRMTGRLPVSKSSNMSTRYQKSPHSSGD